MAKKQTRLVNAENLCDVLEELESLMTERIVENNTTAVEQGIMHKLHTHVYMYYRSKVREAQRLAKKLAIGE